MTSKLEPKPAIAVLGGTGSLGHGLSLLWGRAGFPIIIGPRSAQRANTAVTETCEVVQDKIAINTTVRLVPTNVSRVQLYQPIDEPHVGDHQPASSQLNEMSNSIG
jgi:hypothetical protein